MRLFEILSGEERTQAFELIEWFVAALATTCHRSSWTEGHPIPAIRAPKIGLRYFDLSKFPRGPRGH